RKYAFNKISEQLGIEYKKQWVAKKGLIQNQTTIESNNLRLGLRPLETRVAALQVNMASASLVKMAQNELDNYETRINASESMLRNLYDDLKAEVEKLDKQLDLVEYTLDNSDAASFGFLPGESVVMAVKAVWARDGKEKKDDPEGVLFLTDQRFIFEQKEEIATKKVLFVTTERELVQKLQFETPVVSIESVKATKQGLFKNEDWIELVLATGSFSREVSLHLDGQDSAEWQKLINRVKTKEIDADRAIALDKAAVEKAKTAPTQCPNCGGAITKPVLRGMDTITCEFCGNVIRL
ncbi:MAG: TFIIB-type zinc ribbon-containing protein, partial [Anaerolineaceae bacterium]